MKRHPRHRTGDIQAAGADGQGTDPACGRRMRIRSQQRLSRFRKAFQMDLMTDTVSRTGKQDPVFLGHRLQIFMVIRIFKSALQRIVIDIADAQFRLYLVDPHRFQLQIRHRSCRILCQRLIDRNGDRFPADHIPLGQVSANDLFC